MNRRSFLRAATGCVVAGVAAPTALAPIEDPFKVYIVETVTGWVSEQDIEEGLIPGLNFQIINRDPEWQAVEISFKVRRLI